MGIMSLDDVLSAQRDEVLRRWERNVRGNVAPEALSTLELLDHMPQFVDSIIAALRADGRSRGPEEPVPEDASAPGHGAQRLRLGFDLNSVVREYGTLRDVIVDVAHEKGAAITWREIQILGRVLITGIAHAVSEYAHQRDAELVRQANEHFAFIAHELRNPLSSATLAFHALQRKRLLPEGERTVQALERGLERATDLVDRTLQTARVASGIALRRSPTTLGELFEDAELAISSEAEAKGIELQVSIEADRALDVDRRLVSSALDNLARNAVKYTAKGSTVQLRGRVEAARVVLEVEDCCGGLEPGMVERAFSPFVRMDPREGGFGLGLAIAKQAVDAHGGSVRVQNLPGKGCIFVMELPLVP
jgi:signal transduction histidine kinase